MLRHSTSAWLRATIVTTQQRSHTRDRPLEAGYGALLAAGALLTVSAAALLVLAPDGAIVGGTKETLRVGAPTGTPLEAGAHGGDEVAMTNARDSSFGRSPAVGCLVAYEERPLRGLRWLRKVMTSPQTCSADELEHQGLTPTGRVCNAVLANDGCVLTTRGCAAGAEGGGRLRFFFYPIDVPWFGARKGRPQPCFPPRSPGVEVTNFVSDPTLSATFFDLAAGRVANNLVGLITSHLTLPSTSLVFRDNKLQSFPVDVFGQTLPSLLQPGARGAPFFAPSVFSVARPDALMGRVSDRGFVPRGEEHLPEAGDAGGLVTLQLPPRQPGDMNEYARDERRVPLALLSDVPGLATRLDSERARALVARACGSTRPMVASEALATCTAPPARPETGGEGRPRLFEIPKGLQRELVPAF